MTSLAGSRLGLMGGSCLGLMGRSCLPTTGSAKINLGLIGELSSGLGGLSGFNGWELSVVSAGLGGGLTGFGGGELGNDNQLSHKSSGFDRWELSWRGVV
jgi:hypothetical protein